MKKSNQHKPQGPLKSQSHLGIYPLISLICGIFVMAALFFLLAQMLCSIDVPQQYLPPIVSVALWISVLITALIFARLHGKSGLICGVLWGVGVDVVLLIAAWTQGTMLLGEVSLLRLCGMLFAGGLGGYMGVLWQEKKRKLH
ncbi:MAG: TIGR04086 family membrane protein [Ruthenibacterium sp.]